MAILVCYDEQKKSSSGAHLFRKVQAAERERAADVQVAPRTAPSHKQVTKAKKKSHRQQNNWPLMSR